MPGPSYVIRDFVTLEDFRACSDLQEDTWGNGFSERVPAAILKVSQILGGVSAGAYNAEGRLVGFVFGMTGLRGGRLVHWSDMLAVREEARDSGLGARLKAFQRDKVLALGVDVMHWTFDPLQSRNAYLNFAKLGITVREYACDMYGETDSPLHAGIGTDRFIAHWALGTARVERRLAAAAAAPMTGSNTDSDSAPTTRSESNPATRSESNPTAPSESSPTARSESSLTARSEAVPVLEARRSPSDADRVEPADPDLTCESESVTIAIPADIGAIMGSSMDLARDWRTATRAAFLHYLERGWEVRDLRRDGSISHYMLVRGSTADAEGLR